MPVGHGDFPACFRKQGGNKESRKQGLRLAGIFTKKRKTLIKKQKIEKPLDKQAKMLYNIRLNQNGFLYLYDDYYTTNSQKNQQKDSGYRETEWSVPAVDSNR